ncbi:MAG TPA: twitching motility protein, partial [Syntrophales bacterium]|nr:twitching motility protein [Syntrophales bacterium]
MFRKQDMDYILDHMLRFRDRISDLNMTVGKPLQVESDGVLVPADLDPPLGDLTPFQTEMLAMALLNRDRRLTDTLL